MGFDSYSPQSELMHCSKQSHVYLTREILFQQVRSRSSQVVLVGALATLVGCAPLAEVREINPRLGAQHGTLPQLQRAEQQIANGQEVKRTASNKAIGSYLAGLQSATSELRNSPNDRIALRDYNFAISRVFSATRHGHLDPWTRPLHVPAPNGGEYLLTNRAIANRLWRPALLLRRELEAFDRTFPHHRSIILVGHSMGGIISRLMITDSGGDRLWPYFFGKPPAETKLSPESKALVEEGLIFEPRRNVARVIFISTPHRGSIIAQNSIGRIGSSLIRKS